ncbi:MAG: hypothetical protein POELPBGB_01066 [Bacteroidia bacterium]|nr:hypothetical protein [Bacteroidia bacterium]
MTHTDKIWRLILLTVFGTWFTYKLYKSSQGDFILNGPIFFFIAVIGLSVFVWTIRKDTKEYRLTKTFTSYLPTLTGLFFILTILGLHLYQNNKTNSPTLISGINAGSFNGFSVDFKTDGNYVMANGSGLGQNYTYGTYSINDSIITLNKSNVDKVIATDKLIIRSIADILQQDTTYADYIIQVDQNGKELNKDFRFKVTEDNRKALK